MNIVAHNLVAMNAQRQFGINTKNKAMSTEKLASGYKINRAADDAAGLAISEKMRRQIRGLTQGVRNSEEGVSLCQVADGALAEVDEMLHRITELSVKSANGTNTEEDRQYIQEEIREILEEIDRISDTTTFNEMPIFKGTDEILRNPDGSPVNVSDVEFGDLVLADLDLGRYPINSGDNGNTLRLRAIVDKDDSIYDGHSFNLIYGSGSTSNTTFRVTDQNGNSTVVSLANLQSTNYTSNGSDTWSREFVYSSGTGADVTLKQSVQVQDTSASEKKYVISYEVTQSPDVAKVEMMVHVDTAYNNNDQCEGYFINGNRVENVCVYSQNGSALTDGATSSYVYTGSVPSSFSIVDVDNALAFSEKISFGSGNEPDSLSIGYYHAIDEWSYYDNLDRQLGATTDHRDLGFSLYYDMTARGNAVSYDYGIIATQDDNNLQNVPITQDTRPLTNHIEKRDVWIQSGVERGDGLYITIDEMNTDLLGIRGLDVSTVAGAERAMDAVKGALSKISDIRSTVGAQQNRLEHVINNENNIVENTTAAESRIRDTDMAKEMVRYSNINILEQAGYAMMTQANQSNQGVLSLLQ